VRVINSLHTSETISLIFAAAFGEIKSNSKRKKFIMGNEIASGISTFREPGPDGLDSTFVWDVVESGSNLQVTVKYGAGSELSYTGTATIPVGSTEMVKITPDPTTELIIRGSVKAAWGDNNQSYIVTFSGTMDFPKRVAVFSSDQSHIGEDAPIIIYAYLN
jgi:hypothetical protein